MSKTRAAITIVDKVYEDSAITLLKPYSGEYRDQLFVIYEDAYGELTGKLELKTDIQKKLNFSDEEFNIILDQLE